MIANNVGDCSCSDYKSSSGYGKCEKAHASFPSKGTICYVNQPTTCADAEDSSIEPGKKFSWEPCKGKLYLCTYINKFRYLKE